MDVKSLFDVFVAVPDPRVERTRLHILSDIIAIAVLAVIAGAEGWTDIETYGRSKQPWLEQFLDLPHGIPSHDTFARLFARIDPDVFQTCFEQWVQVLVKELQVKVMAIDGKTLRGSYDRNSQQSALQIVSAWAGEHHLILGQVTVAEGSNEQAAIPSLLTLLNLEGSVVTIDAAGTQKAVAQQIIQQGGDYVLALKGNQPTLHAAAENWFNSQVDAPAYQQQESGHHRQDTREIWVAPASVLEPTMTALWPGLMSVIMVKSERQLWNKTTEGVRYYLSSLEPDALQLGHLIRQHWGIENQLHWVLDVSFKEDASRIRKDAAPPNMATLRRLALTVLKQPGAGKGSLRTKRYRAGLDNRYMEQIITAFNVEI